MEEGGLLQVDGGSEGDEEEEKMEGLGGFGIVRGVRHRGAPWFESLVEEGKEGWLRRQKGGHTSGDGGVEVEWEVMEWNEDGSEDATTTVKRKIGEVEEMEDSEMKA